VTPHTLSEAARADISRKVVAVLRLAVSSLALAVAAPLAGATAASAGPYDAGLSTPREDSYYPAKGDPGIDTLHYFLDLTWRRKPRVLAGKATIRFRATTDADQVRLDLSHRLTPTRVTVAGAAVPFTHDGNHLVINADVVTDRRYVARVAYRGTPGPARGPASRADVARLGMRVTRSGQLWTMQEPFGAFTWYPVNDHPSDKALYTVRVNAPGTWLGISNGKLVRRRSAGNRTITRWTSEHPMASYLTTLAVGPYRSLRQTGPGGLPLRYWVPRNRPALFTPLKRTPAAMRWLQRRLGPYPFETLSVVVVPGTESAMETQSTVTLGAGLYRYGRFTVREIMLHELAHSWYGDTVTPDDWRDLWMNEGMAMWLEARWYADQSNRPARVWREQMAYLDEVDQDLRDRYGPPGDYLRDEFASTNVYYSPALMWERLRHRVGDAQWRRVVRAWPQRHRDSNADRDMLVSFWENRTGLELSNFFHKWLMNKESPA
jgi:aminopeptidase N